MTAKELQPKINKAIKELSLNGNINEKEEKRKRDLVKKQVSEYISKTYPTMNRVKRTDYIKRANSYREGSGMFYRMRPQSYNAIKKMINQNMKPPPPQKNKKANLKKLVNNTLKGRAGKNASRLKKNINEGVSEMTVKTRLAQLNKQTKYQTK
jgi:hypothetical protein